MVGGIKTRHRETETLDMVSRLAMTLRMLVTSMSVKSASVAGNAAATAVGGFTADTGGDGGSEGLAADGNSTACVTGVRFLALT